MYKTLLVILLRLLSCINGQNQSSHNIARDVHYGESIEQVMDIYEPISQNEREAKAIFVIHGGAWSGGNKRDIEFAIPFLLEGFPHYTIVNMEYRLATILSPGYPKQIDDVGAAISFMKSKNEKYGMKSFVLIGGSAGAHLALLYGYKFDKERDIRVLVNVVGPVDFTDPAYKWNPIYNVFGFALVGPHLCVEKPDLCAEVSPITHINRKSHKTISFYGDLDPLIANSQGERLLEKLNNVRVINEFHRFPGGHATWEAKYMTIMKQRTIKFIKKHF